MFTLRPHSLLLIISLAFFTAVGFCVDAPVPPVPPRVRVLIVDGFSNHDWQRNTARLREIFEASGLFDVSVSTSPPKASSPGWDAWRPAFSRYDVVVQTCNDFGGGPSWPETVRRDFETYVREGGGVFIYHSANNAFPDWPAYNRIIGLGWRKASQGIALAVGDDGEIIRIPSGQGRNTGHGARVDAVVTRLGDHPIHRGLPRSWKTPDIEIYQYARGPAEDVEVLSCAHDAPTGMNWPMEWTVTYGRGRVYAATYGHFWRDDVANPTRLRCVAVQTLMVRALWWLARRTEPLPVPADFPTPVPSGRTHRLLPRHEHPLSRLARLRPRLARAIRLRRSASAAAFSRAARRPTCGQRAHGRLQVRPEVKLDLPITPRPYAPATGAELRITCPTPPRSRPPSASKWKPGSPPTPNAGARACFRASSSLAWRLFSPRPEYTS